MEKTTKIENFLNYLESKDIYFDHGELQQADSYTIDDNDFIIFDSVVSDKIDNWLNHNDIKWGYADEYTSCHNCRDIISLTPGYYGDTPNYMVFDDGIFCKDCCLEDSEGTIKQLENQCNRAIPDWFVDTIKEAGFICLDDGDNEACQIFQNGLHPGMNDNPADIIKNLAGEMDLKDLRDKYNYLFCINYAGQFEVNFSLFLQEN